MTQFNSQEGAFGLARQASDGTYHAPTHWMKLLSSGIGGQGELRISEPEIGGTRDIQSDSVDMGPVKYGGPIEFNCRPNTLGLLLLSCFGSVSSAAFSGARKHTFNVADTLQRVSAVERIGASYETFKYTDMLAGKLEFSCGAGEFLKGTADFVGMLQESGASASESYETTSKFKWAEAVLKIDGIQYYAKDVTVTFDNQVEDDFFGLGKLTLIDMAPKRRIVELQATFRPSNSDLYKLAAYGDSNNTSAGGAVGSVALNLKASSVGNITAAQVPYSLELDIPWAAVRPFEPKRSGDDPVEQQITFAAAKDTADVITAYLVNNETNYNVV